MPRPIHARVRQRRFSGARETAFVGLLLVGEHLARQLDAICAPHGLTHAQYNVLRILRGVHPDGHPRFEIARRLISRAPDVTRLLDRLEKQGFVARSWHPENRRHSMATITAAGLAVLDEIDPELQALQRRALQPLDDDGVRALGRMLDLLLPGDS